MQQNTCRSSSHGNQEERRCTRNKETVASGSLKTPTNACWSWKRVSYRREGLLASVFSCLSVGCPGGLAARRFLFRSGICLIASFSFESLVLNIHGEIYCKCFVITSCLISLK